MWMVSLEMVMPFQPRRMAPLGLLSGFFSPMLITCAAEGVTYSTRLVGRYCCMYVCTVCTVGSLKIAPTRLPASTASFNTCGPHHTTPHRAEQVRLGQMVHTFNATDRMTNWQTNKLND